VMHRDFDEPGSGVLQAAQMEALAGRHQSLFPEHLLKALLDDPEGLVSGLVREAGGDPEEAERLFEDKAEGEATYKEGHQRPDDGRRGTA